MMFINLRWIVYLPSVLAGPEAWREDETMRRAIAIDQGVSMKPEILSFQHRQAEYPHGALATAA